MTHDRYGLALHTTTPELGLALSNFGVNSRCQVWDLGRSLSTHLHQYLAEFIQPQIWTDLGFIAAAKGPGSFTGTRIGMVTARTLAQQLDIPLFAISTLAAVAWSHITKAKDRLQNQESLTESVIAVQMPAQRSQIFAAIYQLSSDGLGLTEVFADTVLTPETWRQTLDNWPTSYQLIQAEDKLGRSVSSLLDLAYWQWQQGQRPHWSEGLPFYGQHPVENH